MLRSGGKGKGKVCYSRLKFFSRNLRVHQTGKFLLAVDNKQHPESIIEVIRIQEMTIH